MAKISLFERIISGKGKKDNKAQEENKVYDFYIPGRETMVNLNNGKALSALEIQDYIYYIKSNFYLTDAHLRQVTLFGSEWTMCETDEELIKRRELAFINLSRCLSGGEKFSIIDALWVSDKIYIDSPSNRRIISKPYRHGDSINLTVKSERKNPEIKDEIISLRMELLNKTKTVENNK